MKAYQRLPETRDMPSSCRGAEVSQPSLLRSQRTSRSGAHNVSASTTETRMNIDDLDTLDLYAGYPAEHRLRACLTDRLSGDDHETRVQQLATTLGYTRPEVVRMWTSFKTRIPLDKLPKIAGFIGVDLRVLVALWVAEYSGEHDGEDLFKAASPVVTSAELRIIELARLTYIEQEEDAAEATMLPAEPKS